MNAVSRAFRAFGGFVVCLVLSFLPAMSVFNTPFLMPGDTYLSLSQALVVGYYMSFVFLVCYIFMLRLFDKYDKDQGDPVEARIDAAERMSKRG